jgi:hypothetical protein
LLDSRVKSKCISSFQLYYYSMQTTKPQPLTETQTGATLPGLKAKVSLC